MKQLLAISISLLLVFVGLALYQEGRKAVPRETVVVLSDEGITVDGGPETDSVFTSRDIIYYEDRDLYDGGYAYGEGFPEDRHSAQEAAAHTVVNITAPGVYRVSGKLSAGQIRVDLGEEARNDSKAVVKLILSDADITCTVAPAILFLNVYECDGGWQVQRATSNVDTARAGANLILEGSNDISGSHVAKIYKENGKQKKRWKQDGAIYSCMSMNIDGTGSLDLTADWEGICSELHMTIQGGDIVIRAQNDGINCSEEKVSVLNINGGFLHVLSGLVGGDGLDSNGFMVIRGGTVLVTGNPFDSPLDADCGTLINGGTVIGFGAPIDLPSNDSRQPVLYLSLYQRPEAGRSIAVTDVDGNVLLSYDPSRDELLGRDARFYQSVVLSSPDFVRDDVYQFWYDSVVDGGGPSGVCQSGVLESGNQMTNVVPLLSETPGGMQLYDNVSFFYGTPPSQK